MFRYIALLWDVDARDLESCINFFEELIQRSATDWRTVFSTPGMRVFCGGVRSGCSEPYHLHDHSGVVLGTVFHSVNEDEKRAPKAAFNAARTQKIVQSQGRDLVESYWGRYVAFIHDQRDRSSCIVRSPSGEIDCLTATIMNVQVYFSSARHCPLLALRRFSVNWDYVIADLCAELRQRPETGLKEVERVMHGECIRVHKGTAVARQIYWHPGDHVNNPELDDPMQAAAKLQHATASVVASWASCHPNTSALLSGGLDSSILVSLLDRANPRPDVKCLNYRYPTDPATDERSYARLVADKAGYELVERELPVEFSLQPLLSLPTLVCPCQPMYEISGGRWQGDYARANGISAYFAGHGGDQLFFQNGAYYICADYIHAHGLRPRALAIALDAARVEGGAFWPALRRGIRDGLRRDMLTPVMQKFSFPPLVRTEVAQAGLAKGLHVPKWFDNAGKMPPGKCWQVIGLSSEDELYGIYAEEDDPENVFPLLAQPLQELCLRIPTHVLTLGGRGRGLARAAFAGAVPAEALNRRSKAAIFDYASSVLRHNLPLVRSLLLDGVLIREGIVDASALQKFLSTDLTRQAISSAQVMHLASTEAWLQQWHSQPARAAA